MRSEPTCHESKVPLVPFLQYSSEKADWRMTLAYYFGHDAFPLCSSVPTFLESMLPPTTLSAWRRWQRHLLIEKASFHPWPAVVHYSCSQDAAHWVAQTCCCFAVYGIDRCHHSSLAVHSFCSVVAVEDEILAVTRNGDFPKARRRPFSARKSQHSVVPDVSLVPNVFERQPQTAKGMDGCLFALEEMQSVVRAWRYCWRVRQTKSKAPPDEYSDALLQQQMTLS